MQVCRWSAHLPVAGTRSQAMSKIKSFFSDDKGLETVEYAVMTALIVAAMVTAIGFLAGAVTGRFSETQLVIEGI